MQEIKLKAFFSATELPKVGHCACSCVCDPAKLQLGRAYVLFG